ncbi:ATPase family gene 2 protein [[Candida] anglica]|uniref:ATPase family gene 2 protein n=1 Tax=[Candida] anglica TaxID=148631 RepID=A0ABP0EK88_9ASCO
MAPKTSSSSSSKSSSSTAKKSDDSATKKVKIPKSFIARPSPYSHKGCNKVYLDSGVLEAMELKSGAFVRVFNADTAGAAVLATVHPDSEASEFECPDKNVALLTQPLRQLGGLLLGDRLEITKHSKQPEYANSLTISVDGDLEDKKVCSSIEKALDSVGIVSPGLVIPQVLLPALVEGEDKIPRTVTIVDVNAEDEDEELSDKFQHMSLESNGDDVHDSTFVSPQYIFRKGATKLIQTKETSASRSKYPHLPSLNAYSSIGGLSKQISGLRSTIELPLHNPTLFSDFGISPPRGILLHGPPGTGKTMLLRCIANSTNAHVLSVNGPSIVSKYLGETENAIRDIFQEAKKYQPSIIFMDEIDSLAPNRNSDDSGETESRVVATLLTMMDGMGDSGRIVVIGATNRPNTIDPALRRPGRFDQEVEIGIPDVEARYDILCKQFEKMNKAKYEVSPEELSDISSKTHGYVGADLTALCRESVMKAITRGLREGKPQREIKVSVEDLEEALPEITPSAMREIFLEMPKVYWTDIGGQHELKKKLTEVVQLPLEAAHTFAALGVSAPKGVLLYGPPGCSKTLTAKALATESGLNFLAVKGPEIFNKYVGESERTIREIFRKARAASPSIIFFDEIDAISGDRESASTSASSHVLTSLLNEIDGVEELKGVVIVAATNRPTEIDPALLRPGRLDRHIYVAPPDYEARLQILTNGCRKFNLNTSQDAVDLEQIAQITDGCSGAEVALLCQEAGLAAVMENKEATNVEKRHFEHALTGISRGITEEMLDYYREFAGRSGLKI